jgi:hypothetical protein
MLRTSTRTSAVLATLVFGLAAFAVPSALAQRKPTDKDKKAADALSAAQHQEAAPLAKLADEVMKGAAPGTYLVATPKDPNAKDPKEAGPSQATTADVTLGWRNDFFKAQDGQIFVPFTVSVDSGKIGPAVAAYLRVVPRGAQSLPVTPAGQKPPANHFEDAYFTDLRAGADKVQKLTRAFAVVPGTYDVYVALRDRPAAGTPAEAPVKVVLVKQELVVPNYHTEELQTSSVLVADKIEQLTAAVAPEAMKERPYVLGDSEVSPAADMKFKKTEELQLVFQIYGAKIGDDKKPDVSVDYVFYTKDASGEKLFNRTPTQTLSAKTLPENFDSAAGHQLMTGQGIPLASFPEGDYRLEIKITDNKTQKSLTRDVNFTVTPAS